MPLRELVLNDEMRIANSGGLLVVGVMRAMPTAASIELLEVCEREVAEREGRVWVMFVVVTKGARRVPEEVRTRSMKLIENMGPRLAATATVILGTGIGATILRAFMAGWLLVANYASPQRAFGGVKEARDWLLSCQGAGAEWATEREILDYFEIDAVGNRGAARSIAV